MDAHPIVFLYIFVANIHTLEEFADSECGILGLLTLY